MNDTHDTDQEPFSTDDPFADDADLALLEEEAASVAEALAEVARLREELALREEELSAREGRERLLIERYREAVVAADPAIPGDMIVGETADEIDASMAAARELVDRVRDSAAPEIGGGAPGRGAAVETTPFEKIREGLGRLR